MAGKPKTLLEMAGAAATVPKPEESALILIDFQKEYAEGSLVLPDYAQAEGNAARLLAYYRDSGAPIFHIVHHGRPGGALFDPDGPMSDIADALAPVDGESIVPKGLPNAFAGTDLAEQVRATGRTHLVVAGLMTHMCVSSTVRAALDLGFTSTVAGDACATRDLPTPMGDGVIPASTLHSAALAGLSDRFAQIFSTAELVKG